MGKRGEKAGYFSIGQVAALLQVSDERVHALVAAGELSAVEIPGAGRYGRAKRISRQEVMEALARWAVASKPPKRKPNRVAVIGETITSEHLGVCPAQGD